MDPDRQERIAQGIALLEQGHSYREASAIVDIPTTTLDRWAERSGADIEQLAERIRRLEKELADQKRIADGEIHRLTTENHKLAQALKAMTPEPPAEPIKETPDE